MKSQVFNIGFVTSMLIFGLLIVWCYFYITELMPLFADKSRSAHLKVLAFQISEILVSDTGYPNNWKLNKVTIPGFVDEKENKNNYLSMTKINNFMRLCNRDYDKIKDMLFVENDLYVEIIDEKKTLKCGKYIIGEEITRIAVNSDNNNILKVRVIVN